MGQAGMEMAHSALQHTPINVVALVLAVKHHTLMELVKTVLNVTPCQRTRCPHVNTTNTTGGSGGAGGRGHVATIRHRKTARLGLLAAQTLGSGVQARMALAFGAAGSAGSSGANGNVTNGASGGAGGVAGRAVQNDVSYTMTNTGTLTGAYNRLTAKERMNICEACEWFRSSIKQLRSVGAFYPLKQGLNPHIVR